MKKQIILFRNFQSLSRISQSFPSLSYSAAKIISHEKYHVMVCYYPFACLFPFAPLLVLVSKGATTRYKCFALCRLAYLNVGSSSAVLCIRNVLF